MPALPPDGILFFRSHDVGTDYTQRMLYRECRGMRYYAGQLGFSAHENRPGKNLEADPTPVIEAYKKDVDRTLLRENLKLTTTERVQKMIAALRFAETVRQSRVKVDGV